MGCWRTIRLEQQTLCCMKLGRHTSLWDGSYPGFKYLLWLEKEFGIAPMALGIHDLQAFFCPGIFKHLNLFQWAALVEEERGDKSYFHEQTPAEMGQRAFLHVGLLSLQCLSNSQWTVPAWLSCHTAHLIWGASRHHKLPLSWDPSQAQSQWGVLPCLSQRGCWKKRLYNIYVCIFKLCLHPASKRV